MSKIIWRCLWKIFETLPFLPAARAGLLRLSGANVGKKVQIGNGVTIRSKDLSKITLRQGVSIGRNVEIDCQELVLDSDVAIGSQTIIYGNSCKIGNGSFVGTNVFLDATAGIDIAARVVIANQAHIYTSDTSFAWITGGYPRKELPVTIKEGAWIGPQAIITPGITIAEKTTVAGLSLIMKSTRPYSVNIGVPATQAGNQEEKIAQHKDKFNTFKKLKTNLPDLFKDQINLLPGKNINYICNYNEKSYGLVFFSNRKKETFQKKLPAYASGLDGIIVFIDGNIAELAGAGQTLNELNTLLIDTATQQYFGVDSEFFQLVKSGLRKWGIILAPLT